MGNLNGSIVEALGFCIGLRGIGSALRQDQGDVVVLVRRVHTFDFFRDRFHSLLAGLTSVVAEAVDQAFFSELCAFAIVRFGDSVGVEGEKIPGLELVFRDRGIPIFE